MVAEPGRLLHDVLRLHEPQLGRGVRRADRAGEHHRAGWAGSRTADAFLSAAESVPLHHSCPEGLRPAGIDLDAYDAREDDEGLCVAEDRLPDRSANDFDGSR